MVIFQTPDGNPGSKQFESLVEAVSFVETLRNEQGVESARMFKLEEIRFDFQPYYRVHVPALGGGTADTSGAVATTTDSTVMVTDAAPAALDAPVGTVAAAIEEPAAPATADPYASPVGYSEDGEQPARRGLFGR